jgi:hypothetical protein
MYENKNNFKSTIHNLAGFSSLEINLYDDNEIYLDFRNMDWTITLQVDFLIENIIQRSSLEELYETFG